MTGQELHEALRASLPTDAPCIDDCPFCAKSPEVASHEEEKVSGEKIYDQEAVDALLAARVKQASEEAMVEADKRIAELEATLAEKDEAIETANGRIEELESSIADAAEAARIATLADERSSQVAEVTDFEDDWLDERKAAWAKQSDDEFAQTLADFEAITEAAKASGDDGKKPPASKLNATRETAGDDGNELSRLGEYLAVSQS